MRYGVSLLILWILFLTADIKTSAAAYNPPERIIVTRPTFEGNTDRTLRYHPDEGDFVIENGEEYFNRPLYGGNTAFRVDAGDKPEFSLYLPGHGGNLRFGIKTAQGAKWLNDADTIISRYRPGAMIYEIRDSLLKGVILHLSVVGLYEADGLIVEVRLQGDESVELIAVFGGADGKRGKRSGDIGCESEPVSKFFQLKPESCKNNHFTIDEKTFVLKGPRATIAGVFSTEAVLAVADAKEWHDIDKMLAAAGKPAEYPVLTSVMTLSADKPVYTALKHVDDAAANFNSTGLPGLFEKTQQRCQQIANRVSVDTPDPYINAAASALCVAADAIWDEKQGSVMHGAVAWRSKYLGWRGPYANDAFGWHDRAKRHLTYWASQQNTSPVPKKILPADPKANLSRNEPSLHSNGDMAGRHYDMNLVYMDALFRHVLWTRDMDLAEQLWPVIERHMAWERRLFRRPFGADKLPLYEAYAAIWASDDLQYNGGGATHTSAYNYYHNLRVARLAKELGKDSTPYEKEAELIRKAMNKYLWLDDCGWYAEFKDLLGWQSTHSSAALWTFYHTLDSQAADPLQAWQMSRFVDTQIAHIPVYGGDIPKGKYFTLPTTNWMPYTWSTNNVVMAEVAHTSLAYWQARRPDKAYELFKGCILDSMYMGKCPGNAGMTTYFDMARGEAQRDFGDAVGTCGRALIEGLFGIQPDILSGVLDITPGFPDSWESASIQHPDFKFTYQRDGIKESYCIVPNFSKPVSLRLEVNARFTEVASISMNGQPTTWELVDNAVGRPRIQIICPPAEQTDVTIKWKGQSPEKMQSMPVVAEGTVLHPECDGALLTEIIDPQKCLADINKESHGFTAKAVGALDHRTVFVRLKQGQMQWTQPVEFDIRKPFDIITDASQPTDSIRFQLQNNTQEAVNTQVVISVGHKLAKRMLKVLPHGLSEMITLPADTFDLLPGSNRVCIQIADGISVEGIVTNWHLVADTKNTQLEPVDVAFKYNAKVTEIFQNEYLSPRSPYCSLAIPKQGIGSWCNFAKTFDVDDSGLLSVAKKNEGFLILPQGIRFTIPADPDAKNIAFTSLWKNYPNEVVIGLSGKARHLYLLMAGSTNSMQSQFDNGQVLVLYEQTAAKPLMLRNPTTWWPIDQDYFIDDFGFKRPEPIPPRVDLKTGQIRVLDVSEFKGKGGPIPGGAATVLDIPLDPDKQLQSVRIRTLANEVVIGLISATLVR